VARQAGVDPQSHPGNARRTEEGRADAGRPGFGKAAATGLRHQRDPLAPPEMLVAVGIAPISAARPPRPSRRAMPHSAPTGRAVSSAPATARPSTSPAASSRTSRHRPTWKCPHQYLSESRLVIGSDEQDKA
jgi:hypothetical protein